ncbi:Lactate dehydrogenase [Sulfitobacter brevis]|uniref:Lactate dehydrogenase n=1 Tax=Sulfitobacter brevis TaxID=74348 RepID=A0A1I2BDF9_9RHOB|nr:2-hydroxyacid dehydrogenase [Sulfitobacter brevis]SFE54175.1 Lactate dehydrogenase [Sulfitobacter brevis]
MSDLLQLGRISDDMREQLARVFTIHSPDDFPAEKITHVLTSSGVGIARTLMEGLPNLKAISNYGVGYDAIDIDAATAQGIIVSHTPNVLNSEVATTTVMLMLMCYREALRDDAWARSGNWETSGAAPLTRSADNQTIGILGLGRIGQAIADKFAPWTPKIVYHSRTKKDVPYPYYDNLVDMAAACDVLVCVTPGGSGTKNIVNAPVLEALGPQGTLINVSRGSVVDEPALITALQTKTLGWAGLDVFENEPAIPQALRDLSNVVLLPHVGSATVETRRAMGQLAVDNVIQHLRDGTMITAVPEHG